MAFNFPDGASNGQTHTASNGTVYRYNGTTWVVDSVSTTSNFDTRYLNTNGDGVVSGSITNQLPSGVVSGSTQITDGSGILSGSVVTELPSGTVSSSAQITSAITGGDLDMGGNKVLFGNVYNTEGDLPNASTYHGMFAHVHGTGHGYFAHGGNWIKLQNYSGGLISGSSQLEGEFLQINGDSVVSSSAQISGYNTFLEINGDGVVSGSVLRTLDGTGVVSGSVLRNLDGTGVVSGSSQLDGYVSSSTANIIQVMTSASYAAITPVNGTLYIIQG